ncbi:MAG: hypothetical protein KAI66_18425 [Lentisphaeria bacterium]|nr:hypothetical protein [Lentisphaeria bacterium]
MIRICCIGIVSSLSAAAGVELVQSDGEARFAAGGAELLVLSTPWVATPDWKDLYRFPDNLDGTVEQKDGKRIVTTRSRGLHGNVTQTMTIRPESITIRYDFDFAEIANAAHLQWVLRLEPERYNGAMVKGQAADAVALRPLAGVDLRGLKQARLILSSADLGVAVSAGDGEWRLQDVRHADWAKCYRLEYNRDFALSGSRKGWIEISLSGKRFESNLVPLTAGPESTVQGVPFRRGEMQAKSDRKLAAILLWHTANGVAKRGEPVGEMHVTYANGENVAFPLRWEEAVTSPTDDPRDLPGGVLAPTPDDTPAWVTAWQNPTPDILIRTIRCRSKSAGWRLLAATGILANGDADRLAAALASLRPIAATAEEIIVSLDGTWRFDPEGDKGARDIQVPSRWELAKGCRNVHTATYSRTFDLPLSFQGQRIALRFDAVGEFCEVRVNGLSAGQRMVGPVPVEFDITGLVSVPSQGNRLEVMVKDDTHFSVPKPSSDWRNRRHWVPHGIGGNNRKGLFQSVTLRGRPPVHVADVRVQTSVRDKRLTVVYELFNSGRDTVNVRLGAMVRPNGGGVLELTLPEVTVELPGQMTTTVALAAEWQEPKLWQPNHPHLYQLRTILRDRDGKRLQRCDTRFGFREVWFEGIHFYLNGIRCNLRGESPSYAQNAGPLEASATTEDMIRRCLDANFNVLRFHAAPAPPHVYDICDEMGMLVIDESAIYASWGMIMPEHPRWLPECRDHLRRWVRRDRNHPSIILWSAENEGLNCSKLSPEQLAEFGRVIDSHDGTRPVIFDGDGTAYGASPASVKHYVRTIADLEDHGGKASGYGRDLRADIYWAAAYRQTIPLGIGEFLFPANDAMRAKRPDVCAAMGLQTRGYRYADWFDIRPYNPHYTGALEPSGPKKGFENAWDTIVKSFAAVAVFDKAYDALGPFPDPPELRVGEQARRTLIVYNDTFRDKAVTVVWHADLAGKRVAGDKRILEIPLGEHTEIEIVFVPSKAGELTLTLVSKKKTKECFRDTKRFVVRE